MEDDEDFNSPCVIIIWEFSLSKIVQTTSLVWSVGVTGLFVDSKEVFESDHDLIYRSKFRSKLRPFIDTKLPENMVYLPERRPAPLDWCTCLPGDEDEEETKNNGDVNDEENVDVNDDEDVNRLLDPVCAVHGLCDECEKTNSACDCDWFYDEHFCLSCGVTLWQCDCNHILEITDKLYDF